MKSTKKRLTDTPVHSAPPRAPVTKPRKTVAAAIATPQRSGAQPELSGRERKKSDKLRQIKTAARTLFSEQGYEQTTLRQIAAAAGVGFGTLFSYAKDKRDLLFMVYVDELDEVTSRGFESADPHEPITDQLVAIFSELYRLYARNPPLARVLLHEFVYFDPDDGGLSKFRPNFERYVDHLAATIAKAQDNRQIDPALPAPSLALLVFFTGMGAVRHWLASPKPRAAVGIAMLRDLLELQFSGMKP